MRGITACIVLSSALAAACSSESSNRAPEPAVTPSIEAAIGAEVVLDASETIDPEGDRLTFLWTQVEGYGEPVHLRNAVTHTASFEAPDSAQRLFFRLEVSDGVHVVHAVVKVDVTATPNGAPVAVAPAEVTARVGTLVTLDGSASFDPDEDELTFRWQQVDGHGEPVQLENEDAAQASFVAPDSPQRLFFRLTVSDGREQSAPALVTVDVSQRANTAPVAVVAEAELDTVPGAVIVLDGSGSFDPDDDEITWQWEQVTTGAEPVAISNAQAAIAHFTTPDRGQRLFFRLTVSDGLTTSTPAIVRVRVNAAPVALPGPPREVPNQTSVMLEASAFDPDGDAIVQYRWSVTAAPAGGESCVEIPGLCLLGSGAAVSFTPPVKGDFELTLVVSDGLAESAPATTIVRSLNRNPLAVPAAANLSVLNGTTVALDGSGSFDPDGDAVTAHRWSVASLPPGATATFAPASADVIAPSVQLTGKGSYFFLLEVDDADGATSQPATLRVEVTNGAPTVEVTAAVAVVNGSELSVLAFGADPDGDLLTYRWVLEDHPPGGFVNLADADRPTVRFTPARKSLKAEPAACAPGECYVLAVVASDGLLSSAPSRVTVVALNRPPVADAGPDLINPPVPVVLDGTRSSDPDGDQLISYRWIQRRGPDVTEGLGFLTGVNASFAPPLAGEYEFDLVVSDGETESTPDRIVVHVDKENEPPVLAITAAQYFAVEGTAFALDASGTTDPDGDPVTVIWTRRGEGDSLFPRQLVGKEPSMVAPAFRLLVDGEGTGAVYDVVATDGQHTSAPQRVSLHVLPGDGYVVVSTGPGAVDDPECGGVDAPCASLAMAISLIDPDGDLAGDGRHVVMTTGQFQTPVDPDPIQWPGATRLIGGRDPTTFAAAGRSDIRLLRGCNGASTGLQLGSNAVDVTLDRARFAMLSDCSLTEITAVRCSDCRAVLRDVEVTTTSPAYRVNAVWASGAAADLALERAHLIASRSTLYHAYGLRVTAGARARLADSSIEVTARQSDYCHAVNLDNARLKVERSQLSVIGTIGSFGDRIQTISSSGGIFTVASSVIENTTNQNGFGVHHSGGGSATLLYNTIIGPGGVGNGAAVRTSEAINLFGNLLTGYSTAIQLTAPASRASRVYANALDAASGALASCEGTPAEELADLNAESGTVCNNSGATWSHNITGPCPLVNPAAGDFHLNAWVNNPCVNAGLLQSAAGVLPALDLDGEPRPGASGVPDIGADEVH